jgi:hypothetical protein
MVAAIGEGKTSVPFLVGLEYAGVKAAMLCGEIAWKHGMLQG